MVKGLALTEKINFQKFEVKYIEFWRAECKFKIKKPKMQTHQKNMLI